MQELLRDIDSTDGQAPHNERMTFAELCDYFEKYYVKDAEYVDGRKVAGMRSVDQPKANSKSCAITSALAACIRFLTQTSATSEQKDLRRRLGRRRSERSRASIANSQCSAA
jgi:hypothetical protein